MSHDYSSDYENEPQKLTNQNSHRNTMEEEPMGTLISLSLTPNPKQPFEEYEIYNLIEGIVKVDLADLSAFRHLNGDYTGIIIAQFEEPVSLSRVRRLHGYRVNGYPLEVRLFTNLGSFRKFCRSVAEQRLSQLSIDTKTAPPLVYVSNFQGDEQSVRKFFERCGPISLAKAYPYKNSVYFTLFFENEASAQLACRTFDGHFYQNQTLIVASLYKNAADRQFVVHHVQDFEWLKKEIGCFGPIEAIHKANDDQVFVLMGNPEDAKAACVLLNKRFDHNVQLKTNFVDFDYYLECTSRQNQ